MNNRCCCVTYLLLFPFSCSTLLSLSGSILGRISMIAGSRVGGLTDPHLHLYPHITSPTNPHSFPYLANFMVAISGVGVIKLSCPMFCDIHLAPKTSIIYNSTPHSSNSQASLYPSSQKFQRTYCSLPSIPPSCPSQCTLIMLLLVTTQHIGSKILALIRENHIKPPFTGVRSIVVDFHT
jgi:hypothetical protein